MAKGMIEIDYPETCGECPFFNFVFFDYDFDYSRCMATGKSNGYRLKYYGGKRSDCPIKKLEVEPVDYIYKGDGIYERV